MLKLRQPFALQSEPAPAIPLRAASVFSLFLVLIVHSVESLPMAWHEVKVDLKPWGKSIPGNWDRLNKKAEIHGESILVDFDGTPYLSIGGKAGTVQSLEGLSAHWKSIAALPPAKQPVVFLNANKLTHLKYVVAVAAAARRAGIANLQLQGQEVFYASPEEEAATANRVMIDCITCDTPLHPRYRVSINLSPAESWSHADLGSRVIAWSLGFMLLVCIVLMLHKTRSAMMHLRDRHWRARAGVGQMAAEAPWPEQDGTLAAKLAPHARLQSHLHGSLRALEMRLQRAPQLLLIVSTCAPLLALFGVVRIVSGPALRFGLPLESAPDLSLPEHDQAFAMCLTLIGAGLVVAFGAGLCRYWLERRNARMLDEARDHAIFQRKFSC